MKFVGYVTVRLNSSRVPLKSIQEVGGKPLINHAISTLNKVEALSDILLYCSQEKIKQYIDVNLSYNFVKRQAELDKDSATFNEILDSLVDKIEADYIVFLSCTSPFIKSQTISDMINHIVSGDFDSAFTALNYQSFCWFRGQPLNYEPSSVPKTQDLEPVIIETSGLYIFAKELFQKHKRRIGFKPHIKILDMFEGWDIDTVDELEMARLISIRRTQKI